MTTGCPPQGLVTVKFLNWMLEHTALGLHVRRATALPNFPDVEPDMFSKTTLVMLTRDGYLAHVAVSIWNEPGEQPSSLRLKMRTDIEVTRIQKRCVFVVAVPKVLERDVVHEPIPGVLARPRLEPSTVLAVEHPNVLNVDVLDEALFALVLANGPHRLPVGAVAVHGVDVDVGGIGLGREAVVANVDPRALNSDALDVERVEEVGVFGSGGRVVRHGGADDVGQGDVLGWWVSAMGEGKSSLSGTHTSRKKWSSRASP